MKSSSAWVVQCVPRILCGIGGFTRDQCLGQWWLHALRQSQLLLEDSPPVTQFSVTGREQSLLPVLRELSSLGKRSPARASCPCLMKQNSLSHLSGRRFLPSVATCSVLTFPFVAIVRGAVTTSFRTSLVSGGRLFSAVSQLP